MKEREATHLEVLFDDSNRPLLRFSRLGNDGKDLVGIDEIGKGIDPGKRRTVRAEVEMGEQRWAPGGEKPCHLERVREERRERERRSGKSRGSKRTSKTRRGRERQGNGGG